MQELSAANNFEHLRLLLQLPDLWFQANTCVGKWILSEAVLRQLLNERDATVAALSKRSGNWPIVRNGTMLITASTRGG